MTEGYGYNPTFQTTEYSINIQNLMESGIQMQSGGQQGIKKKSECGKAEWRWEGGKGSVFVFLPLANEFTKLPGGCKWQSRRLDSADSKLHSICRNAAVNPEGLHQCVSKGGRGDKQPFILRRKAYS